ncbi:MAG: glycyl-radical enzyme activating protein [Firmicutes bacterium]|nr:glycyl-radical enzyme activating protein [Bacillota bacterium]
MNDNFWEQTGRIFDIQKYSIHDGPGIRTIAFLKGCPLRCQWCCNPESQEYAIQTMRLKDRKPKIVGQDVTVREVMEEVEKDRVYYRRSGGGLTLSGGECLMQPDFAAGLLRAAKETGINTAIESTGFAPFETIQKLLPYLDYYLMDIKHTDSAKHKQYTGQPNERILENAFRIASSSSVELIIRVPVVAPFNGTEAEIASIARFAKTLPGVRKIHLLPYHRLGQDKYEGLDRPYLMSGLEPPTRETMLKLLKAAEEASGLYCQIGG